MTYLDYNAGAPLLPEVAQLLTERLTHAQANPSSVHQAGRAARRRLDDSRDRIARKLGASVREVVFTGSGSEAAALAIKGAFEAREDPTRRRIVSSTIEHPCVLGALAQLERAGAEVVRLSPDATGLISTEQLLEALTPETALCSLMWANNETGVIQPVPAIARACVERKIVFHTDAVQAIGRIDASLREAPADLLSFSAHKLGGPAGVGVLIARRGLDVSSLVPGHQENGRRGGTQNVLFAEATALALELSLAALPTETPRLERLRARFEGALTTTLSGVTVNGGNAPRLASTSNVRIANAEAEALLMGLDLEGICVSTGAACASGSLTPSHVLTAMGLSAIEAKQALRFSFGRSTTEAELDHVVTVLTRLVEQARSH